MAEDSKEEVATTADERAAKATRSGEGLAQAVGAGGGAWKRRKKPGGGGVAPLHNPPKYRRYVRRTSKFMAHNERGATVGDKVRIVETRPLSAHKRWRVVEIIQKAEK